MTDVDPQIAQLVGLTNNAPVVNKVGLQALITACLAPASPVAVVWATDPEPFISPTDRMRVVLDVFSITGLAWDERRRVYGLPGYPPNAFVTVSLGNRTVRVTIRAEAFDAGVEAAEIIDQIRSNLYSDDSQAALNAINLAYVDSEAAMRVSYVVDERVVNAAIADFTFGGVAQHVTSVQIDQGWIETVNTDNVVPGTLT